jgi:hypothetical protein
VKFKVTIFVDVDLDTWTQEYGNSGAVESMEQVLADLGNQESYLLSPKWEGLATIRSVEAYVVIW